MKTRPWPLILLALIQILSPIATILFNAWQLDVLPGYVLGWILERPPVQVFETLFLMPIAGIAIWRMKSWSYAVFFAAVTWSLISNFRTWSYAKHNDYSIGMVVAIYLLQIGLAVYFLMPSVRRTYLDPRVRWWEAKRRFRVDLPVQVQPSGGEPFSATIDNLSEGGMLVRSRSALESTKTVRARFTILGIPFESEARVLYSAPDQGGDPAGGPGGGFKHGLQFVLESREEHRKFKRMVRGLELIGVQDRQDGETLSWYRSGLEWALELFTTGKGLVPEVKSHRKG